MIIDQQSDPVYIRGDGNVNENNASRVALLNQLLNDYSLISVDTQHATYHHFVGNGLYDSKIDLVLHSDKEAVTEVVTKILCKHDNPAILSHHDIIMSEFTIPNDHLPSVEKNQTPTAPRVKQTRVKVQWTPEGQAAYESQVGPLLSQARQKWLDPSSQSCMSILLQLTNDVMNMAAKSTNQTVVLGTKIEPKPKATPGPIKKAISKMKRVHKKLKSSKNNDRAKESISRAKKEYKQAIKNFNNKENLERDKKSAELFSKNPSKFFQYVKKNRKTKDSKIEQLSVGDKVYYGQAVSDGFYHSMSALKKCSTEELETDPHLADQLLNYEHILKLCEDQRTLPEISLEDSTALLKRIKKSVKDIYGITSLHYLHAGEAGLLHFNLLLNGIIKDVNNATIQELNLVYVFVVVWI